MKTIKKNDIAVEISNQLGLSVASCEDVVSSVFQEMLNIIIDKKNIHIKNFGGFKVFKKDSRPGRNIKSNEKVTVEARNVVRFSGSRALKKSINNTKSDN
jgi:nucleoid DNA-binding protein